MSISFVCRDIKTKIVQMPSKSIGDCLVHVAKTLTVRYAISEVSRMNLESVILESNSQAAILSITGKVDVSKQIFNLVGNNRKVSWNTKKINCNTSSSTLADMLAKKAHDIPCNMM